MKTQFGAFLERVKKTDCQAELRRLLRDGPPIWLSDPHALPLPGAKDEKNNNGNVDNDNDNDTNADNDSEPPTESSDSENKDTHVCALWYAGDNVEVSSKLEGAVEGDDRISLWNDLKRFLVEEGKEPGDDGDGEDNTETSNR